MNFQGKEYRKIKEYLAMGVCPWSHEDVVRRAIRNDKFPAIKLGGEWYVDLKEAELWFKRRVERAS